MELIDIQSRTEHARIPDKTSQKESLKKLKWFRSEVLKLLKENVNSLVITNMSVASADGSDLYVLKLTKQELSILKGKGQTSKTYSMDLDTFDTTLNRQPTHPGLVFEFIKKINQDITNKRTSTFEEMIPSDNDKKRGIA